MRTFDYSSLEQKQWGTDILNLVAKIHECKGRQDLFALTFRSFLPLN